MKNEGLVILLLCVFFVLVSIPFIRITKTPPEIPPVNNTKTYEQGLWDGFNRTIKYLDIKGVIKDTIHINVSEISKIDSILHSK
jgi:hypothetical protein